MISATIVGNVGGAAEVRDAGGTPVVTFSVASNAKEKVNGQYVDVTTWIRVSAFGSRFDKAAPYIVKGKTVAVRGALALKEYKSNKDGQMKQSLEMRADDVQLVGPKTEARGEAPAGYGNNSHTPEADDSEIPF